MTWAMWHGDPGPTTMVTNGIVAEVRGVLDELRDDRLSAWWARCGILVKGIQRWSKGTRWSRLAQGLEGGRPQGLGEPPRERSCSSPA